MIFRNGVRAKVLQLVHKVIDTRMSLLLPIQIEDFKKRHIDVMRNTLISDDTTIGDYTYVGYNCCITKAHIGRYCSIANNVSIGNGEHVPKRVSTSSLFYDKPYDILTDKDCKIGNDVWIGVDSIIRRGVTIGDGAIIGANSFVNASIPDFAIAVGSPARVIGFRFDSPLISVIKESNWWNYPLDSAKGIIAKLEQSVKYKNNAK